MTKKQCPLGEDCDLTIAWMKGAEDARDKAKARIEALTEQLEAARLDAKEAEAYSVWLEGELAKVAAAFHANFIVKSDTHAHKAFGVGLAELKGDKP